MKRDVTFMFLLVRVLVSVCLPSIVGVKGSFQTTVLCPLILLKHTHRHEDKLTTAPCWQHAVQLT